MEKHASGKLPELLAPAGSRKRFWVQLSARYDAVYLGGEKFGARAYAENFNTGRYHPVHSGGPSVWQESLSYIKRPN